MQVLDVYNFLNEIAPVGTALSFDNVGILVGDPSKEVKKAVVCLDCTPKVLELAVKESAELIITHHPIIFEPLKSLIKGEDNVVYGCIENGVSVISMHTNLDVAVGGVNDCLANALELVDVQNIVDDEGFCFKKGALKSTMSTTELADYVKQKLGGNVRFTAVEKQIKTVAVCGGSGGSELSLAMQNADAFITADVKHNLFIEAISKDYPLLDAGHYHTENVVVKPLIQKLSKGLNDVEFLEFNSEIIKTL